MDKINIQEKFALFHRAMVAQDHPPAWATCT
jgi:hypothetical protein